jgi:hypothetical protein
MLQSSNVIQKKVLTNHPGHAIVATHAEVAQLVEHSTENAGVAGSIPALGTFGSPASTNIFTRIVLEKS